MASLDWTRRSGDESLSTRASNIVPVAKRDDDGVRVPLVFFFDLFGFATFEFAIA